VDRVQLVRDTWDALSRGELEPLAAVLAPDARWLAVQDGPWNCESAAAVVEVMGRNLANGMSGRLDEVFEVGGRIVVAFRPDNHANEAWPLDNGIRYVVVSMAGEQVTEIKGCANREVALSYAAAP
jgi:ketosteroid isomerase-like protein